MELNMSVFVKYTERAMLREIKCSKKKFQTGFDDYRISECRADLKLILDRTKLLVMVRLRPSGILLYLKLLLKKSCLLQLCSQLPIIWSGNSKDQPY